MGGDLYQVLPIKLLLGGDCYGLPVQKVQTKANINIIRVDS